MLGPQAPSPQTADGSPARRRQGQRGCEVTEQSLPPACGASGQLEGGRGQRRREQAPPQRAPLLCSQRPGNAFPGSPPGPWCFFTPPTAALPERPPSSVPPLSRTGSPRLLGGDDWGSEQFSDRPSRREGAGLGVRILVRPAGVLLSAQRACRHHRPDTMASCLPRHRKPGMRAPPPLWLSRG